MMILFYEPTNIFRNLLFAVFTLILIVLYIRFFFGYIMRNFERQADLFCFESGIDPRHMIGAFEKLNRVINEPADRKNWHHFNIPQRIDFLHRAIADPGEIIRHNRKVNRVVLVLGLIITLLFFSVISKLVPETIITIKEEVVLRIAGYKRLIQREPDKLSHYLAYAELNELIEDWEQALSGYRHAIRLNPKGERVINNYAWRLLTCKEKQYRDYRKGLVHAKAAWNLVKNKKPKTEYVYIIDTLAEAYYRNRVYDKAFRYARLALKHATENRSYYKKQLQKIRKARLKNLKTLDSI